MNNSQPKGFSVLRSSFVPLPIENIDTDQIIPARFLKATTREGFGENLFRDWRYDIQGNPIRDFVLNNSIYAGKILVAGKNFGCGSSREHAAWAIADYGFQAVVSSFFADIFKGNALNNHVLPVQISPAFLNKIFQASERNPLTALEINLPDQKLIIVTTGDSETFDINPYKKDCFLRGVDDIEYLLSLHNEIETYEKKQHISHQ